MSWQSRSVKASCGLDASGAAASGSHGWVRQGDACRGSECPGSQGSFSAGMVWFGEEGIGSFSPGLTGKEDNDRQRATGLCESRTEEKQRTLPEMEKGNGGNK